MPYAFNEHFNFNMFDREPTKDLWTIYGFDQHLSNRNIPYNLRSLDQGVSILDIALPGFSSDDIEIEFTPEKKLIVKSNGASLKSSEGVFVFLTEQFNTKSFECEFVVSGTVSEATMENGILSIRIETEPKPSNTKIHINKNKGERQILTERTN